MNRMRYSCLSIFSISCLIMLSNQIVDSKEKSYDPYRMERFELIADCSEKSQVSYEYLQDIEDVIYDWVCSGIVDVTWKSITKRVGESRIVFAMEVGFIGEVDYRVYAIMREPQSAKIVMAQRTIVNSAPIQVPTVDSILAAWEEKYSFMELSSFAQTESESIVLDGSCEFIHVFTKDGIRSAVFHNMIDITAEPYAELYREIKKTFDKRLKK